MLMFVANLARFLAYAIMVAILVVVAVVIIGGRMLRV